MDQDDKVCTRETHASVEATRGPARRDTHFTLVCGILLAGLYRKVLLKPSARLWKLLSVVRKSIKNYVSQLVLRIVESGSELFECSGLLY